MSSEIASNTLPFSPEEITHLVPAENERTDELFDELDTLRDQLELFIQEEQDIQAALQRAERMPQGGFGTVEETVRSLKDQLSLIRFQKKQTELAIQRNTHQLQEAQEEIRQERERLQNLIALVTKIQEKELEYDRILAPFNQEKQSLQGMADNSRMQKALEDRETREKERLRTQLEPIAKTLQSLRTELQQLDTSGAMKEYYGERANKYVLPQKQEYVPVRDSGTEPLPFDPLPSLAPVLYSAPSEMSPPAETAPESAPDSVASSTDTAPTETLVAEDSQDTLALSGSKAPEVPETQTHDLSPDPYDFAAFLEEINTPVDIPADVPSPAKAEESLTKPNPEASVKEQLTDLFNQYTESQNLDEYLKALESLVLDHPQDNEVITNLIHVYLEADRILQAKDLFKSSEQFITNQVDKALFEAYFLLEEGETDKTKLELAQQKLEFVVQQSPSLGIAQEMLAVVKEKRAEETKVPENPSSGETDPSPQEKLEELLAEFEKKDEAHPSGISAPAPVYPSERENRDITFLLKSETKNEKIRALREEIEQLDNRTHEIFDQQEIFLGQPGDPTFQYKKNNLELLARKKRSELLDEIYYQFFPEQRPKNPSLRDRFNTAQVGVKSLAEKGRNFRPQRTLSQAEQPASESQENAYTTSMLYRPSLDRRAAPVTAVREGFFKNLKERVKSISNPFRRSTVEPISQQEQSLVEDGIQPPENARSIQEYNGLKVGQRFLHKQSNEYFVLVNILEKNGQYALRASTLRTPDSIWTFEANDFLEKLNKGEVWEQDPQNQNPYKPVEKAPDSPQAEISGVMQEPRLDQKTAPQGLEEKWQDALVQDWEDADGENRNRWNLLEETLGNEYEKLESVIDQFLQLKALNNPDFANQVRDLVDKYNRDAGKNIAGYKDSVPVLHPSGATLKVYANGGLGFNLLNMING